jgi:hypothetical protein
VIVIGLDEAASRALAQAGAAERARALAVYTGGRGRGSDFPAIAGTHAIETDGFSFRPRFPFVSGVPYIARFEWRGRRVDRSFEVAPPAAADPPRVVAIHPSGDTLPENTLRLYVQFSRPMTAHGARGHVHLLDDGGHEVPLAFVPVEDGLWDPGRTRLTLLFHPGRVKRGVAPGESMGAPLRAGHEYRLVVDGEITDIAGTAMGAPHERRFRAIEADRASPRLAEAAVTAPRAAADPLIVTLPEPLDQALVLRWMWVEDARGTTIDGRASLADDETRWTFQPERPWTAGAYAVRLRAAIEDRAGNRFDRLFDREGAAAPSAGAASAILSLPFDVPVR